MSNLIRKKNIKVLKERELRKIYGGYSNKINTHRAIFNCLLSKHKRC